MKMILFNIKIILILNKMKKMIILLPKVKIIKPLNQPLSAQRKTLIRRLLIKKSLKSVAKLIKTKKIIQIK